MSTQTLSYPDTCLPGQKALDVFLLDTCHPDKHWSIVINFSTVELCKVQPVINAVT